jgi:hypothetical protein
VTPANDDDARGDRLRAARALVGRLLAGHPEARSLLSEASHWRGLAVCSAAVTAAASRTADLARLRYEELRHRVDPRCQRRGRFGTACALVAMIGVAQAGLARIELAGWLDMAGRLAGWLTAAAAAAVWIGGAWLAAGGGHERRGLLIGAAVALAALLAGLDEAGRWDWVLAGALCAALSVALAVTAAALIARAEPASVARARRHWRRAVRHRDTAARTALADAEMAAVTRDSWLGLVCAASAEAAAGDEQLASDALAVAAALI